MLYLNGIDFHPSRWMFIVFHRNSKDLESWNISSSVITTELVSIKYHLFLVRTGLKNTPFTCGQMKFIDYYNPVLCALFRTHTPFGLTSAYWTIFWERKWAARFFEYSIWWYQLRKSGDSYLILCLEMKCKCKKTN